MKVESIQDWIMPANERINVAYIHIGYGLFNIRSVECKVKMAVCHTTLYSVYRLLIGKMIADTGVTDTRLSMLECLYINNIEKAVSGEERHCGVGELDYLYK